MGLSDPVLPPLPGASSVGVGDTLCPGDRLEVAAMHDPNTRKAEKVKGRLLPAGAITFRAQSFNFRLWRFVSARWVWEKGMNVPGLQCRYLPSERIPERVGGGERET